MKEIYLTRPEATTYSGSMPDGTPGPGPEAREVNNHDAEAQEPTPEQRDLAQKTWGRFFETNPDTPADERAAYKAMEEAGRLPENAVWKNRDNDQPVKITGYFGLGPDGREYVSIEGSTTGVPLDEIEFLAETPSSPDASREEHVANKAILDARLSEINKRFNGLMEKLKFITVGNDYVIEDPEHVSPELDRLDAERKAVIAGIERLVSSDVDKDIQKMSAGSTGGRRGGGSGRTGGGSERRFGREEDPRDIIFWRDLKDPELQRIAENVAIYFVTHRDSFPLEDGKDILLDSIAEIESLSSYVNQDEADRIIRDLRRFQTGNARPEHLSGDTVYIDTLKAEDLAVIDTGVDGPIRWLEGKFNTIYETAQEGQEISSELIRNYQQSVGIAMQYLERQRRKTPEIIKRFGSEFSTRLNLIYARSQVERREVDGVIGAVQQLTAHGLFNALSFDGGRVEAMYKSLQDNYDDMRLRQTTKFEGKGRKFHVTPEMNARLQSMVEEQQMTLALQGLGVFGEIYKIEKTAAEASIPPGERKQELVDNRVRERLRREIRRSVRTAYDTFVVSQRQAVIVARGQALDDPGHAVDNFLSDPGTLFAAIYNQEAMLTGHFFLYNAHNMHFLDEIKLGIAEGKLREEAKKKGTRFSLRRYSREDRLDYGTRLVRDLAAVPDFWSSGWRVKKTLDQITDVVNIYKSRLMNAGLAPEQGLNPEDFGLFLRLRDAGDDSVKRTAVWERIAKFKPEEIIKLFRERIPAPDSDRESQEAFASEIRRDTKLREAVERYENLLEVFEENGIHVTEDERRDQGVTHYDRFKTTYGPLISAIREAGFSRKISITNPDGSRTWVAAPIQIDFTDPRNRELIDTAIGREAGDRLIKIFEGMQDFAGFDRDLQALPSGSIPVAIQSLLSSTRFEDIYKRTLVVDDALLNQLENVENIPGGSRLVALSKRLGPEIGGDALVRNAKDTKTAIEGFTAFLSFIREDDWEKKIEAALKFAENASIYNGQGNKAEIVRYTVGTALYLAKEDLIWDALALSKSPWRSAISKMQKIYGQHGKVMSRDELRVELDKYYTVLTDNLKVKDPNSKEYKKAVKDAERYYKALETLLEANLKGRAKEKGLALFFVFLLVTALEAAEVVKPGKAA